MKWTFGINDGGRESGFHDAGVETFTGDFDRYLARELIQNSLDARLDPNKPVIITFRKHNIKRTDIPDIDTLQTTLEKCRDFWSHIPVATKFCENAFTIAK